MINAYPLWVATPDLITVPGTRIYTYDWSLKACLFAPTDLYMASASSPATPLVRTQTKTSAVSSRRLRPRSPLSMYVACETASPKPPKPLLKLDKKQKNKQPKEPDPPNPFPARSNSFYSAPPTPEPHRRPSISSFLTLRRKKTADPPFIPPPIPSSSPFAGPSTPSYPSRLHETNVHPVEDVEPMPLRLDKASRLLGRALPPQRQRSEPHTFPDRNDDLASDFSDTFRTSPRSSSDGASSWGEDSFEGECFTDDAQIRRESALLSPIEFTSRPPSLAVFKPLDEPDTRSEWGFEDEPATSLGPLPSQDALVSHARSESYSSVHDHFSYSHARVPSQQHRPDTPFMDAIVAVNTQIVGGNSQVLVARGHARESSVIRTETKDGWMGEWNQGDMKDVIHKLRTL
ncbi:hypothetical protein C8R44DRAFT_798716, partial [Mycena epipterygia]